MYTTAACMHIDVDVVIVKKIDTLGTSIDGSVAHVWQQEKLISIAPELPPSNIADAVHMTHMSLEIKVTSELKKLRREVVTN